MFQVLEKCLLKDQCGGIVTDFSYLANTSFTVSDRTKSKHLANMNLNLDRLLPLSHVRV